MKKANKKFLDKLLVLKDELLKLEATGKAAAETVVLDQTRQGRLSRMDAMQQQEMSKASNARRKTKLKLIDAAILRIENNEFGLCLECDEDINPKRLEHNPTSLLCIACASALEK